ncbi:MAG TPA: hypothetical protein VGG60_09930 [Candidatus Binataceae bacterium]
MPNVAALHHKDDRLCNVGRMVSNLFERARNENELSPLADSSRLLDHRIKQLIQHAMMQGVDLVIGFDHGFRQRAITILERVETALDHGARSRCHALDVTVHIERTPTGAVAQARADIDRLIADALQIGCNLETRHDHPKVPGSRLVQGEDAHATLIDFAVETVNCSVASGNGGRPIGIAREQAPDGVANLIADQFAHAQERFSQFREILLVAAIGMLQQIPPPAPNVCSTQNRGRSNAAFVLIDGKCFGNRDVVC